MSSMAESGYDYDDFDTDGFPHEHIERRQPGFLTAPFASRTWRESLHLLINLPVGILTFTYVVTTLSLGLATAVTFLGMPVLAALVVGARGLGAMERARAHTLLDVDVTAPEPLRPARPGLMGWIGAALRSGSGWRSALYGFLMLPMGVLSFALTVTLWVVGIGYGTYPLWQWVFPTYTRMPGLQLYSDSHRTVYLSSVPQIAGVCAVGLLVLFTTPWVVRGLANVQRAMVRGLLSR